MKSIPGLVLSGIGLLLLIFRMPLVYALVGKFKTRVALFLGIDKLKIFMAALTIFATLLIVGGLIWVGLGWRRRQSRMDDESMERFDFIEN